MSKTPEEIEATKKAADKAAADEGARKAALDAGADDDDDDQDGDLEFNSKQKAYIEKLRKENAKTRVESKEGKRQLNELNEKMGKFEKGLKALAGDDESLTPEEKLQKLTDEKALAIQEKEALAFSSALKEAALEHGVNKETFEYFEFLVAKKVGSLKDGEELSEKELAELAKTAKAKSAPKSTSVDGKGTPSPDEDDGELKLEEFQAMGIVKRSMLYEKNPKLYESMVNAEKIAKKKK